MSAARAIGLTAARVTLAYRYVSGRLPVSGLPGHLHQRLAADQKRIWRAPANIFQGDDWLPALGAIAAIATAIAFDPVLTPPLQRAAFQNRPFVGHFNRALSGANMAQAINAVPLIAYIAGLARDDEYARDTAILAAEAAAHAEVVAIVMKHLDRRARPGALGPDGDFTRTWFKAKQYKGGGTGCFPSGHTASAVAVATIFAERYRENRWIAPLAWVLAGTLGLSRITTRAHYPSDVLAGALLGYTVSHSVVMRRHNS